MRPFFVVFLVCAALAAGGMAVLRGQSAPPAPARALSSELDAADSEPVTPVAERPAPDALKKLVRTANLQRRRGDYVSALGTAREGLARATQLGDERQRLEFLYLIGRIQWNLTDYPKAIESHLEELRIAQKLGDDRLLARTHTALGMTLQRFGQAAPALEHYGEALKLAQTAGDRAQLATILNALGNHYLATKDYARAREMHTRSLEIREALGHTRSIADSLTNVGLVDDATGDTASARRQLERALAIYQRFKMKRYIANTHRRLASVLRHSGDLDGALQHLDRAVDIATPLGSEEVMAAIHEEYALTYEQQGDFRAALEHQRQLAAATEAMRGEADRQRIAELRALYETEQRDLQIRLLRRDQELQTAEIRRRRFQNLALGAGLILGVVLFGAVIVVQRTRLRAERRLHAATEHARERAENAERMKSRFLQIASHDLKTPLNALTATADLLRRAPDEPLAVERLADGIRADTARMAGLVRDFLDAAAIEEGSLELHLDQVDLIALTASAVESLRSIASTKEQTLVFSPPASLPPVRADLARVRQIYDNLLSNAFKFTPAGGTIEIVLGQTGDCVFAEVRDSGPGLQPEDFGRLFAPYARLSARPTGKEASTGLGLFITHELLALQGGRLEVESQPGAGAVFRFLLPAMIVAPTAELASV